ncbi:SDR family oxidoreductase [Limnochorda pilosa]|uniref:Short-chain dehydrogenase n=1 Tax=Limnochorda pilosa TaxID=1555112 RepID=A0A0K2SI21_LIMPI|nr:SDR family oxidoreductase [Limnochorda pilosa]BAS26662.1 short-chain dehydrogenase [Limnochorda pilosa]
MAERLLEGKAGLVTGGSSGIGRATALAMAREGARVAVADVAVEGGEETVRMMTQAGGDAVFIRTDVSRDSDVAALVRSTVDRFGRLDVAVNNAGIEGTLAPLAEYPEEMFDRVVAVNLKGVWLCMKHEIPELLEQGGGAIVNMASILGLVAFPNAAAYTAAKHGVVGLTRVAAVEYAARGIRVNAVCPGFIETPMVMERGVAAGRQRETYEKIAGLHPIGRLGKPEEIAGMVVALLSDRASFVTGAVLPVDGALTAQ